MKNFEFSGKKQHKNEIKMGTVLSFSPREKAGPPYPDYHHNQPQHQRRMKENYYENYTQQQMTSSSSVNSIGYGSSHGQPLQGIPTSASSKSLKKHSMFLNALSWKKFSNNQESSGKKHKQKDIPTSARSGFGRQPLDNIHPMIDSNKNIQNALCHGAKTTLLNEKHLDLAPTCIKPTEPEPNTISEERKESGHRKDCTSPKKLESGNFFFK